MNLKFSEMNKITKFILKRLDEKNVSINFITNQDLRHTYIDEKILIPRAALADNATQFKSKQWVDTLTSRSITIKYSSVYFPQGNMTERVNREIGRVISTFCHEKHSKWAHIIKDVENCLNKVVHETTGYIQMFLQFGKNEPNPIRKIIKFPEKDVSIKTINRNLAINA